MNLTNTVVSLLYFWGDAFHDVCHALAATIEGDDK